MITPITQTCDRILWLNGRDGDGHRRGRLLNSGSTDNRGRCGCIISRIDSLNGHVLSSRSQARRDGDGDDRAKGHRDECGQCEGRGVRCNRAEQDGGGETRARKDHVGGCDALTSCEEVVIKAIIRYR